MQSQQKEQTAMRVSSTTLVINILLAAFKLIAGVAGHSSAMVSDAVHTFSDGISTVIVMIGIRVSCREPDNRHQYGYERYECVAAILLAGLLLAAGFGIGYEGLQAVLHMDTHTISTPPCCRSLPPLPASPSKRGCTIIL